MFGKFSYLIILGVFSGLLITMTSDAQTLDSLEASRKVELFFKLNSRRSFVAGGKISIRGFRLGAEFRDRHRVGVGIFDSGLFGLNGGAIIDFFDLELSPSPLQVQVDLGYVALFYEYALYKNKKWNINFDTQIGIGKANKKFKNNQGILVDDKKVNKPLAEATIELKYRIFPWVSTSAGIGYRYILDGNDEVIRESFNSPIYVLKVRLSISYFFRKIVSDKK